MEVYDSHEEYDTASQKRDELQNTFKPLHDLETKILI